MAAFFVSPLLLILSIHLVSSTPSPNPIGINYGRIADNLPTPNDVVKLLQSHRLTRAKLYDSHPSVLSAFSNSNISLIVSLPNSLLPSAASHHSFTDTWLKTYILPFYPDTNITAIAVGNEVFSSDPTNAPSLIPAMSNLYSSLKKHNLHASIKISSPLSLSALTSSFPPSSATFDVNLVAPILHFLRSTSSFLMVNAYPFLAYSSNKNQISLDYALGNGPVVVDSGNGLCYSSLFDAQVDAVFAAMKALQYDDVPVVVTETGWPSHGDVDEAGASIANAASYNGNLVRKVLMGGGTPLKADCPLEVYLFALFNENQKPGPTSERNYGLFYPDQREVYQIPVTVADLDDPNRSNRSSTPPVESSTWCVANGEADTEKLQEALDYACGEGGADCRPIQSDATCYNPNTLEAHASYAFNSYYQMRSRAAGTCYFGGAAFVTFQPPRYGSCIFPASG